MQYTHEHLEVQKTLKRFIDEHINPHVDEWEAAEIFPAHEVFKGLGKLGLLGLTKPEAYGGAGLDYSYAMAMAETLGHIECGGVPMAIGVQTDMCTPALARFGSDALRREFLAPSIAGDLVGCIGVSEPGGGSDVAALKTTARRDGDHYIVNGEKIFITSGMRADWITAAVRTGEPGSKGAAGISMIVVPGDAPGLHRTELKKMGWWCSDTAQLRFDNVRVPAGHLLGEEGGGFRIIMTNFNGERLAMSAMALGFAQACLDEALDWARQRKTFGAALIERQVIRHKLVDMQMRIHATQAWVDAVTAHADAGDEGPEWVAQVCMLKNQATQTMQFCADQAVQILGGMGFMRGTRSERIYREVKVMMIGGGSEEIMKDLAARQLGV